MYVVILHLLGKPRHYAQVLISDLCLNKVNNITSTYMKAIKPTDQVVTDDISFPKIKFNLEDCEKNRKLLNIYWTPKFYKSPTKARFISGDSKQ